MNTEFHRRISASHPSLPGHFPGRPVVPGVVVLSEVVAAVEEMLGCSVNINQLPAVKFTHPLLPEDDFVISLEVVKDGQIKFRCMAGDTMLANGNLRFESVKGVIAP